MEWETVLLALEWFKKKQAVLERLFYDVIAMRSQKTVTLSDLLPNWEYLKLRRVERPVYQFDDVSKIFTSQFSKVCQGMNNFSC